MTATTSSSPPTAPGCGAGCTRPPATAPSPAWSWPTGSPPCARCSSTTTPRRSRRPGSPPWSTTTSASGRPTASRASAPPPASRWRATATPSPGWARSAVDADRMALWGSSFSGGEVIILAGEDLPIRCAVAQVPALGDGGPDLPAPALAAIGQAVESGPRRRGGPGRHAAPDGLGVMYEDGAHAWFTRMAASGRRAGATRSGSAGCSNPSGPSTTWPTPGCRCC